MDCVPFRAEWLAQHAKNMPHIELAILTLLIAHICLTEQLLPLDLAACQRITGAIHRDEQRALNRVLATHFDIVELGRVPHAIAEMLYLPTPVTLASNESVTPALWERCSTVTAGGVTQREQNAARQKRHRAAKAALRQQLANQGVSTHESATISELRKLLPVTQTRNDAVTPALLKRDSRERAPADLPEYQIQETQQPLASLAARATPNGQAALAMKAAGLQTVNPSHPELAALLSGGVTVEELADAARDAAERGKGFAYALAVARGRRADAARAGAVSDASKDDSLMRWAGPTLAAKLRGGTP